MIRGPGQRVVSLRVANEQQGFDFSVDITSFGGRGAGTMCRPKPLTHAFKPTVAHAVRKGVAWIFHGAAGIAQ